MYFKNIKEVVITDRDNKVVSRGLNLDKVKEEARNKFPSSTLIGTIIYEDGTKAEFFVGYLVGMGF